MLACGAQPSRAPGGRLVKGRRIRIGLLLAVALAGVAPALAADLGLFVCAGIAEDDRGIHYNTQFLVGPHGYIGKQRKIHLPGLVFPLLAALTPDTWRVRLLLEVVDDIDVDAQCALGVDIVAIGAMGYAIYRGAEIADAFRARGKTVVFGGYMASMVSARVLEHADAVVIGDAERAWPRLLRDWEQGRLQPLYDMPVDDISGLPLPRYELLTAKPVGNMLPVQAGRGCPHQCSFCSVACIYRGRYLARPVHEVLRDIRRVRELGFKRFYLLDGKAAS